MGVVRRFDPRDATAGLPDERGGDRPIWPRSAPYRYRTAGPGATLPLTLPDPGTPPRRWPARPWLHPVAGPSDDPRAAPTMAPPVPRFPPVPGGQRLITGMTTPVARLAGGRARPGLSQTGDHKTPRLASALTVTTVCQVRSGRRAGCAHRPLHTIGAPVAVPGLRRAGPYPMPPGSEATRRSP